MTTLKLFYLLMVIVKKFKIRQLIWRLLNNICISPDNVCNGIPNCHQPLDEGPVLCDQVKCDEPERGFLCNNYRCISEDLKCNNRDDCGDYSDERPESCDTTTTAPRRTPEPTTIPARFSNSTEENTPVANAEDTESSSHGWVTAAIILTATAVAGTLKDVAPIKELPSTQAG